MSHTISPSILSCHFLHMGEELKALENVNDIWLHLDIMDGHFVDNLTFGPPLVKQIAAFSPHRLDVHLMVTNPEFHMDQMKDVNIHNITFHLEALEKKECLPLAEKAKKFYPSVGISLKPQTPPTELSDEILKGVDLVLLMSVEPGHGGQDFLPHCLEKIHALVQRRKKLETNFTIQVDGGINEKTAPQALHWGADNLVVGSYIFASPKSQYTKKIKRLQA